MNIKKMEKRSKDLHEFTQKRVKEAGLETAPVGLYQRIMNTVELIPVGQFIYKPLISKKAWIWIGVIALAILAILVLLPWGGSAYVGQVRESINFSWENPLANIKLSKTAIYAILGIGLFLLQIPILKRQLDKRYKK